MNWSGILNLMQKLRPEALNEDVFTLYPHGFASDEKLFEFLREKFGQEIVLRYFSGVGDSICILPKFASMMRILGFKHAKHILHNAYPMQLYDVFKCFNFCEAEYILDQSYLPIPRIHARESTVHYKLAPFKDEMIDRKYWNVTAEKEYDILIHPVTMLKTPRRFDENTLFTLLNTFIEAFPDKRICLVGHATDINVMRPFIIKTLPNKMVESVIGEWDCYKVVQTMFEADMVLACDSWIALLAGFLGKRCCQYILGKARLGVVFESRIVSPNYFGFNNINIDNIDVDRIIRYFKYENGDL